MFGDFKLYDYRSVYNSLRSGEETVEPLYLGPSLGHSETEFAVVVQRRPL